MGVMGDPSPEQFDFTRKSAVGKRGTLTVVHVAAVPTSALPSS